MKKTNKTTDINCYTLIGIIVIIVLIELIGNYCNTHAEERRQKDWDKFEKRMQEVHHMTKW